MKNDYRKQQYVKNTKKIRSILQELPVFAADYFTYLENREISVNTRLSYAYDIRVFFRFLSQSAGFKKEHMRTLPIEKLELLTPSDLQEYISYIAVYQDPDGENTSNKECGKARKIASLRSFFSFFYDNHYIRTNPAALIKTTKIPKKRILRMDKSEVASLLSSVSAKEGLSDMERLYQDKIWLRDTAILTLLLGTGLRVSECVGLDIEHVDFKKKCLYIIRKGSDEDVAYFEDEVAFALQEYIQYGRDLFKPCERDKNALFLSSQHKRMGARSIELMIKKYAKRAGIGDYITPHRCRSTFGTNLYRESGDLYMVAEALHHSSVETTRKHYAAMEDDQKRKAAFMSSSLFNVNKDIIS